MRLTLEDWGWSMMGGVSLVLDAIFERLKGLWSRFWKQRDGVLETLESAIVGWSDEMSVDVVVIYQDAVARVSDSF